MQEIVYVRLDCHSEERAPSKQKCDDRQPLYDSEKILAAQLRKLETPGFEEVDPRAEWAELTAGKRPRRAASRRPWRAACKGVWCRRNTDIEDVTSFVPEAMAV